MEQENETLVSKTHLKKVALELQELGEKLTTFKVEELNRLSLSEKLFDAIIEYKRLPNAYGARKRQLQFIGKLMREYNKEDLEKSIANLSSTPSSASAQEQTQSKELATTLTQLVVESGDEGINQIVSEHPLIERQYLRRLLRDYKKADVALESSFQEKIRHYIQQFLSES